MSEQAITAARSALNDAIAARDADAMAAVFSESYHVVTALNTQRSGREESRRSWAAMFAGDPTARYERITRRVEVNAEMGPARVGRVERHLSQRRSSGHRRRCLLGEVGARRGRPMAAAGRDLHTAPAPASLTVWSIAPRISVPSRIIQ
jgi:uncharacterized protein (TIGR02246 family)